MKGSSKRNAPRIALVGCGAIAERYYMPAIAAIPSVLKRLVLVDTDEARLQILSSRFCVQQYVSDYHELLGQVDAAIVAVPHHLHYEISMDFLRHGAHVLCEKPLAESSSEAKEMVAEAKKAGLTISANHTRRLYPSYAKIKELISSGRIGNLLSIRYVDGEKFGWPTASGFYFSKASPMGVLLDRGVHGIDAICWWLGLKPRLVSSRTDSFGRVEGTSLVVCEHNGCHIEIKLSWLSKLQNRYSIVGELGTIEGDIGDWNSVTVVDRAGRKHVTKLRCKERKYDDFGTKVVENLVDIVSNGAKPLIPASEVIPSLELIEESYRTATRFSMPWYAKPVMHKTENTKGILVTGGAGYIGGWIVEALHLNGFANIRGGIRRWSSAARIARFPVDIVQCDITDKRQIAQAMKGVSVVIHCATGDRDVIVQGTENVLEVGLQHGIERFIHLSSAEVYGDVRGRIDEKFPYQYTGIEYADSKIEAEKLCWEFHEMGLPVTILRPSIVYGPFGNTWTISHAARLQSGRWGIFEDYGEGICNLVYVEDLVAAVLLAIRHENAIGEAFNISGAERITWNQYFQRFNDALGLPNLPAISAGALRLKSAALDEVRSFAGYSLNHFGNTIMDVYVRVGAARFAMKKLKNLLDTQASATWLQLYSRDAHYVTTKAQRMLGYGPKFDLDAGLRRTVLWLDHHGFLDS